MEFSGLKHIFLFLSILQTVSGIAQEERISALLSGVAEGQYLSQDSWLINQSGDTISFKVFDGKWLIVDYWSYGCRPCIKEFPHVNELYKNIDHEKLEIIGIYVGEDTRKWKKSLNKYPIEFPSFHGGWSASNPLLSINFQLNEEGNITTITPQYVLIDPDGKIVNKNLPKPSDPLFDSTLYKYIGKYR